MSDSLTIKEEHLFKKEGDFVNHSSHLTTQQQNIKNCKLPFIAVKAYAGSGKTTVLFEYAKANSHLNGLYLAFNRNIAKEASQKFPTNVTCKTIHSLAYSKVGFKYQSKISNFDYKIKTIAEYIHSSDYAFCEEILFLLKKFIASSTLTFDDYFLSIKKKEIDLINKVLNLSLKNKKEVNEDILFIYPLFIQKKSDIISTNNKECILTKKEVDSISELIIKLKHNAMVKQTSYIWDSVLDISSTFPMSHDAYLKAYQLSQAIITQPKSNKPYDFILYDEAQDSNDCTIDILLRQPLTKIFVGDPYQQIYQFRGAINAFDKIKDKTDAILPLSKSWRFGQNIADLASIILSCFYKEQTKLEGINLNTEIIIKKPNTPYPTQSKSTLYLYRTNAQIVADCINEMRVNPQAKFFFIGNIESYMINQVLDYYYLYANKKDKIKDNTVKKFDSWVEFMSETGINKDVGGQSIIQVVHNFEQQLEVYIPKIKHFIVDDHTQANRIISTAHKAKGREFDNVILGDDFLSMEDIRNVDTVIQCKKDYSLYQSILAEINLLYVAVTRAKRNLYIPLDLMTYLLSVYMFSITEDKAYCYNKDTEFFTYIQKHKIDISTLDNPFFTKVDNSLLDFIKKIAQNNLIKI